MMQPWWCDCNQKLAMPFLCPPPTVCHTGGWTERGRSARQHCWKRKASPGQSELSDSSDVCRAFVTLTKGGSVRSTRLSLCVFQVPPDLEVLRVTKKRRGARKVTGGCPRGCSAVSVLWPEG